MNQKIQLVGKYFGLQTQRQSVKAKIVRLQEQLSSIEQKQNKVWFELGKIGVTDDELNKLYQQFQDL